jgi:hypothetical protein
MRVNETNEIRELTAAELEGVAGGLLDPMTLFTLGMVVGVAGSLAVTAITVGLSGGQNLWERVEAYANSQR